MTTDPCFYCAEPIGDAPAVHGVEVVAHRACVRAELVKYAGEDWETRHCDGAMANRSTRAAATKARQREEAKNVV